MPTSEKNQPDELLQGFEQLARKYAELNLLFWKEGAKMLTHWATDPSNRDVGNSALRESFNDWLAISHQHIDDLMDLGKHASHRFNEAYHNAATIKQTARSEPPDATVQPAQKMPSAPNTEQPHQHVELKLSGLPGETILSGFNLKSANGEQRNGNFEASLFHPENGGAAIPGFRPVFQPDVFWIMPGIDMPVGIEAALPSELQPGIYRAHVVVHGFEQSSFDVVLTVEKEKKPARKKPQPKKKK